MPEPEEIRAVDDKGRVTLPRSFAGCLVLIEQRGPNEIVIRKAKVVPLADGDEPDAAPLVLSRTDWARFVELLENPPAPNAELRALVLGTGPKGDGSPFEAE